MATEKQKRLAKAIVENATREKPLNKKELLVSSGYSESSAESVPSRLIEQEGVQEELTIMGFSVENAKSVVAQILDGEDEMSKDRLKAADMVFKVHGSYVPEPVHQGGNTFNFFGNEAIQQATKAYEDDLKRVLGVVAPTQEHGT